MSEPTGFEELKDLFRRVLGREPEGRVVTESQLEAALIRMAEPTRGLGVKNYPTFRIPNPLLTFWEQFGGESKPLSRYFQILQPETLIACPGHIVIAFDPRAGERFGIHHYLMDEEDPGVWFARSDQSEDIFAWDEYSSSLYAALSEFTAWNVAESLAGSVIVDDCRTDTYRSAVSTMERLPQSSDPASRITIYYTSGLVVCEEPQANTAMIGYADVATIRGLLDRYGLSLMGGFPLFDDEIS